jgi:outer membrane immunogenic protein
MRAKARRRLASLTLVDIAIGAVAVSTATSTSAAHAQGRVAPSWTGYYIGAHAGYRWGVADLTSNPYSATSPSSADAGTFATYPGRNEDFKPDGIFGGAHLGYNWQFNPNWLIGLEGDWSWGRSTGRAVTARSGNDSSNDGFSFVHNSAVTLLWQATLRARAGYVVENSLWYVTGGAAFARVKWSDDFAATDPVAPFEGVNQFAFSSTSTVRAGWVVGAGFEQMFASNWTWRAEYLYENFGSFAVPQGLGAVGNIDLAIHKVRIGITFKP